MKTTPAPALLLLLTALSAAAACFALHKEWLLFATAVAGWLLVFQLIRKRYRRNAEKIAFLFDSIDNGDQAFRFAERDATPPDQLVNNALNRINRILFQAKAEIAQKEKYYELIINSVNTGIIVIDDDGFVFQSNREAFRLLGLSVFTHVRQLARVDPKLEEVLANIQAGEKQQISFSNERGVVHLMIRVSGMEIQSKRVRIIAINDINKELDEKEIDSWVRLTRVLTHEIMNSVTPITSLSETLLSSYGNVNPIVRDGLQAIHSTGRSLISFVESYRKFTILPTPSPTLFYVLPFARRMRQLAQHHNAFPNTRIELEIDSEDLIVYADEDLISQVVLNLLKNALEAIGSEQEDGLIVFRAYSNHEDAVIIEISNNGPSIPQEIMEHIFVPFFTTKEGGSGIGLSVSRQIMRLSGGSLAVRSEAETCRDARSRVSTCFTIAFP